MLSLAAIMALICVPWLAIELSVARMVRSSSALSVLVRAGLVNSLWVLSVRV
jgi:hypothetical protein